MLRTPAPGEGGGALGQCSLVWKPAVEVLGAPPERLCAPACGGMIITLPPGKDCPNLHSLLRVCVSNLLLGETGPERGLWDAEEHLEIASGCPSLPSRRRSASRTRGSADLGRESRRILEETVSAKNPGTASGVFAATTLALSIQRFCVRDACITCGREDHAVNDGLHGPALDVGALRRTSSLSRFSSTINSCWWI